MTEESSSISPASQNQKNIHFSSSKNFNCWLCDRRLSLAFTSTRLNKIFLLGSSSKNELSIFERSLDKPTAIHYTDNQLFVSTAFQVWRFKNILTSSQSTRDGYDSLFVPRNSYVTGEIGVIDLKVNALGEPIFSSSLFSCVSTVSQNYSFAPLWRPPFISKIVAETRCFLNGLALHNDKSRFVTTWSQTNSKNGWCNDFKNRGIVIDISSDEIICDGLTKPGRLCIHENILWLSHSGTGYIGTIDFNNKKFNPVIFCPGLITGFEIWNDFAFIALSKMSSKDYQELELGAELRKRNLEPWCGIFIVDLKNAKLLHWVQLQGLISELDDLTVIPDSCRPSIIGFQNQQIKRTIYLP